MTGCAYTSYLHSPELALNTENGGGRQTKNRTRNSLRHRSVFHCPIVVLSDREEALEHFLGQPSFGVLGALVGHEAVNERVRGGLDDDATNGAVEKKTDFPEWTK